MQHERDKKGRHGGYRSGAGRKSLPKVERMMIAGRAATALHTPGPPIENQSLPHAEIEESRAALRAVPISARKKLPPEAKEHLEWLQETLDGNRVVRAERRKREEVFAAIAAEETRHRGITITGDMVERWYDTFLPPRRGTTKGT